MTARVLIVDDLIPNLKLIEARLSAEYFEVLTATNGADALALCASGKCDIVLLDVMMPGMDGLEVCRRLKGNKATAHIPVVMVTALDQPSSLLHGLEACADDFLAKPIDELALLARVNSHSRLRFALDELRSHALRSEKLGIGDPLSRAMASDCTGGRIMVAEDSPSAPCRSWRACRAHAHANPVKALCRLSKADCRGLTRNGGSRSPDRLAQSPYLEAHLGALLGQTRPDRLPLCATILDLDDFKFVNDRHGHGAGDQVLQAFVARAKRIIRGTDILCRRGGDEFVMIMPGTSLRTGYGIAEEIRAATAS